MKFYNAISRAGQNPQCFYRVSKQLTAFEKCTVFSLNLKTIVQPINSIRFCSLFGFNRQFLLVNIVDFLQKAAFENLQKRLTMTIIISLVSLLKRMTLTYISICLSSFESGTPVKKLFIIKGRSFHPPHLNTHWRVQSSIFPMIRIHFSTYDPSFHYYYTCKGLVHTLVVGVVKVIQKDQKRQKRQEFE